MLLGMTLGYAYGPKTSLVRLRKPSSQQLGQLPDTASEIL